MPRIAIELRDGRLLDDLAEVHHRDTMAHVRDDAEIVRDEQIGEAHLVLQPAEQIQHLRLDRDVERGDRLVGDDEAWPDGERTRDADPLTLPAAELVRIAIVVLRAETDLLEQLVDTRALRSAARETVDLDALGDDRADAHARVQRRVRVLKDDLHVAPHRAEIASGQREDVAAVERDGARRRLGEAQDTTSERRLAAAGLADDAERLARPHRQVDARDGVDGRPGTAEKSAADRVLLAQAAYLDERRTGRDRRRHDVRAGAAEGIGRHDVAHTRMHAAVWRGAFSSR